MGKPRQDLFFFCILHTISFFALFKTLKIRTSYFALILSHLGPHHIPRKEIDHLKGWYVYVLFSFSNDRIRLVQLGGKEDIFILDLFDLGEEGELFLRERLSSKGIVGHNLMFDLKYLYCFGIEPYAVLDTLIASQLLGDTV